MGSGMAETGFLDRVTNGRRWQVYVPYDFKPGYPAILFLHGMGESGTEGVKQSAIGISMGIRMDRSRWPFLVVLPQKPTHEEPWTDSRPHIDKVLEAVEKEFDTDPHRRYITGLSQGGFGTFELAAHLRWNFAAAAPVCGWRSSEGIEKDFKDIPIWAFHGEDDPVVPAQRSKDAIEKIKASGGDAQLTLLPGVQHNSWDHAYQKSDLPNWLLSHNL